MITARVRGIEQLNAALRRFPQAIASVNKLAGRDAANNILKEPGLQRYPPGTERNQAGRSSYNGKAKGFYVRGRGWMSPAKGSYKLNATSEKLGTKWYVLTGGNTTLVGNMATYAVYVHGDYQPAWAKQVGWKKLYDVAKEKFNETVAIYERHIGAALKRMGL